MKKQIALAIHGGAGTITRSSMTSEKEMLYREGLKEALERGYQILSKNGSSLDAVEAAVRILEDNPLFNAGRGSVFTHDGNHEMDAAIMDGSNLKAGAVAGVTSVRNPIQLARLVMDKTEHVLLVGKGAEDFAERIKVPLEQAEYFFDQFRYDQLLSIRDQEMVQLDHTDKKFGTVGAVALDKAGNLAAATSTGGMTNKRYGRVGDTPLIGAGTYANNKTCAVSCTGHGEYFIRSVVAFDISCLMEYAGKSLVEACDILVHDKLRKIGGEGGLIAIDQNGEIYLGFNSEGMYRGWKSAKSDGIMIYKE